MIIIDNITEVWIKIRTKKQRERAVELLSTRGHESVMHPWSKCTRKGIKIIGISPLPADEHSTIGYMDERFGTTIITIDIIELKNAVPL